MGADFLPWDQRAIASQHCQKIRTSPKAKKKAAPKRRPRVMLNLKDPIYSDETAGRTHLEEIRRKLCRHLPRQMGTDR